MRSTDQNELWGRIDRFSIDDPTATTRFSDKLAGENGWTPAHAQRVIIEYKRFIFLCCISSTGASPSYEVDQAWHLHLTYTENYWKKFCRDTLHKEIHHHPSAGGNAEDHRHQEWYSQTLDLYREVFEEEPPRDIWPLPRKEQVVADPYTFTDQQQVSVQQIILLVLLPFTIPPLFFIKPTPYQLTGPQFLVFYLVLIIASIGSLFLLWKQNKQRVHQFFEMYYRNDANSFQLSRFVFGRNRSIETAIVDLVERGILKLERVPHRVLFKKEQFVFSPPLNEYAHAENNPILPGLLKQFESGSALSYSDVAASYDDTLTYHEGLSTIYWQLSNTPQVWRYLIVAWLGIIGFIRIVQGAANNRPVTYLGLMIIAGIVVFFIFNRQFQCKEVFKRLMSSKFKRDQLSHISSQSLIADQFAFIGITALGMSYITSDLQETFRRNNPSGDGGASGSGCGSSSCGSSCGGSGCGGCGGGD